MSQPDDLLGPRRTIGLTGGIATGKSLVLDLLTAKGACGIDADAVYHDLIRPGARLWEAIRDEFGPDVVRDNGEIDRRQLGAIVFGDRSALARLDRLTHPAVVAAVRERLRRLDCDIVVVDAVKLIESGLAADCDEVWLVTAAPDQQIDRLMNRNQLSRQAAMQRVRSQSDPAAQRPFADVVIDNSGTLAQTEAQVESAWADFVSGGSRRPESGLSAPAPLGCSPHQRQPVTRDLTLHCDSAD